MPASFPHAPRVARARRHRLLRSPPNDGVLNTIGALGIAVSGPVAFNVVASAADKNEAWLLKG